MAPPAQQGQQGGGGGFIAFLPLILIFLIFYMLILRPQAKRQRMHQQMLDSINKGDRIVSTGGLHGVILKINEREGTLLVKFGDDVKIVMDRAAVARKLVD